MENINFEYIGAMIKTVRIDADTTQDELAERLGVQIVPLVFLIEMGMKGTE